MRYGICSQSMVSLRETPSHKSQMVNQLLFGDLFLIKDEINNWFFIETIDDNYKAWVDDNQVFILNETDFKANRDANKVYSLKESITTKAQDDQKTTIRYTFGSSLPNYEDSKFSICNNSFIHTGDVQIPGKGLNVIEIAKEYLESPYLWGGRSIFGIDCSGFTQIVFKLAGILLARDSSQQIEMGSVLSFIEEAKEGDLAFFENEEGLIVHVGILIDNHTIIHASGKVRIDKIDHNGIYNQELQKYTHKLRLVKRIFE